MVDGGGADGPLSLHVHAVPTRPRVPIRWQVQGELRRLVFRPDRGKGRVCNLYAAPVDDGSRTIFGSLSVGV